MPEEQQYQLVYGPQTVVLTDGDVAALKRHAVHRCEQCGAFVYIQVVEVPLSIIIKAPPNALGEVAERLDMPTPLYAYPAVKKDSEPRCSQCGARVTSKAERVVQFVPQGGRS
jgi:hypothetical protein